ncbi:MAG: sugar phosphate isomerase/epimerase family protein [Planctomycetaceae bacterium]
MRLGYNTNGLACHRWQDALALLAEIGYRSVAITLDHSCLDPWSPALAHEVDAMQAALARHNLASVIETGARFLLDLRSKHEPTLLSHGAAERARRVDFLKRAVDIAANLGSDAVSLWSGVLRDSISPDEAFDRLAAGCREVLEHAEKRGVRLAFEPEPGMFVDTFARYERLLQLVDGPLFGLTIDLGHVHCLDDGPIDARLREWRERLFNVHIEDMRRGIHEHLRFGEGEIDFVPVMRALAEIGYEGGVHVELSRHSHMAPEAARESFAFLSRLMERGEG